MKAKKLITLCLVGMLAVASTSSVLATTSNGSGEADFLYTYTEGIGPTDPPTDPDPAKDKNNWAIKYPKAITLTDTNVTTGGSINGADITSKGHELRFSIRRKEADNSGSWAVTNGNIGDNGINVTVEPGGNNNTSDVDSIWNETNKIQMYTGTTATTGTNVFMAMTASGTSGSTINTSNTLVTSAASKITSLTPSSKDSTVTSDGTGAKYDDGARIAMYTADANNIKDNQVYNGRIKFTFTRADGGITS